MGLYTYIIRGNDLEAIMRHVNNYIISSNCHVISVQQTMIPVDQTDDKEMSLDRQWLVNVVVMYTQGPYPEHYVEYRKMK